MASIPQRPDGAVGTRDRTPSEAVIALLLAEACPPDDVVPTPETPLTDGGLELSSLDLVRAIVGIEESLGIELGDEEVMDADLRTVADVLALVARATPPHPNPPYPNR
ncbi:acyl carrier protein [Streptomyces sp. B6B3]|uniref:acyl carrier protein n=1 Tax=Streptomyces sp. B6B3 TaxID=3153570 RepID=UPI00325EF39E